jgi:hypothetical protein
LQTLRALVADLAPSRLEANDHFLVAERRSTALAAIDAALAAEAQSAAAAAEPERATVVDEHHTEEIDEDLIGGGSDLDTGDRTDEVRVRPCRTTDRLGITRWPRWPVGRPGAPEIIDALGQLAEALDEVLRPRSSHHATSR